ncbi:MAG: prepilin peptidase [Syntrophobacteraceae bacterium CG07_land_8_20_14_0_80_61_8]|nr:MAG: prepilin peptidase [Syntrophobacteraceae bacterium CG07_land_8_20_14_0_80_61_8]
MTQIFDPTAVQWLVFVCGCCLGSFFNVVIYRLPNAQSIVKPASHCPACQVPIAFYDNIPLLSYVLLRGRCRHCRVRISLRYPLVEALTGVLLLMLLRRYGWGPAFLIYSVFACLLLVISFIDWDTFLIPDVLSLPGILVGFTTALFNPRLSWLESLVGIVLGGGVFYLVAWGYQRLRRQEGLGGGDIKLLAMIGAFCGWPGVVFTILLGSLVGTVVGIAVMWKTHQGLTARIPFGPFLALGAVGYIFWGEAFFNWYLGRMGL